MGFCWFLLPYSFSYLLKKNLQRNPDLQQHADVIYTLANHYNIMSLVHEQVAQTIA